jgi:hypothetical protein
MISNTFALSKLSKRKLIEVIKYSKVFFEFKYVRITNRNTVVFGRNVFQYIFKPKKIELTNVLSLLDTSVKEHSNSIKQMIDYLYAETVAKKYNLSPVNNNTTLRALLRRGATKEALYIEHYIHLIYGYVKDKHSAQILSILEVLNSAKNVVTDSTDRVEVIIKNAILRELSLLRSPPNRATFAILKVAS